MTAVDERAAVRGGETDQGGEPDGHEGKRRTRRGPSWAALRDRLPAPRQAALSWAELAGLCALAIAEPIFEELQQGLEVYPGLEVRGREIVVFAIAMVVGPATLLWIVELLAGLARAAARKVVHAAIVAFLIASMVWQAAHGDSLAGDDFAAFALVASFAGVLALYLRTRWLPAVTRVLALAAPLVVVSFLLTDPANRVFGAEVVEPPARAQGPPVVMLVFDELPLATLVGPDGRIDRRLFPNFARLADDATWYRNARTVADQTIHAVPALLSGTNPDTKEEIGTLADYPHNVFTLLGGGDAVAGSEVMTDLCGPSLCPDRTGLHTRVAALLQIGSGASVTLPFDIVETIGERLREETTPEGHHHSGSFDAFLGSVESLPAGRPSLAVHHMLLPHVPWTRLPGGQSYPNPGDLGIAGEAWSGPDYFIELGFQRHVLQTQFVDRELGRLMRTMRQAGIYDEAVLAVTADHGAAFLADFSRRGISPTISGWVLPVPMFVKESNQTRGRADDATMRTIDLVPTVAQAAGVEAPEEMDGRAPGKPRDPKIDRTYLSFQTGTATIPSSTVEAGLRRALAARQRFLPGGTPFALGGHAELIGRRARQLGTAPLDSQLDYPAFADVYPEATTVNAFASGTFPGYAGAPDDPIAFALNGRIAATGRVFGEYGEPSFATVVPLRFLRRGENRFEIYPISTSAE